MIAFGTCIVDPAAYLRYARPGIQAAAEPGAPVFAFEAVGNICRSYNLLLDAAARRDDLEALVLLDEHVELRAPGLAATVRDALRDPDVAVLGALGARDVRSIAWWEGRISVADVAIAFDEQGGGQLPWAAWADADPAPRDVDMVDGRLLVLSPWAVRTLRFDEELVLGFGYDLDFCLRVREEGRRVRTAPIPAVLHQSLELVDDRDLWVEAHIRFAEKWEGRLPGTEPTTDWRRRARRAEAERDAARTRSYSASTLVDAQVAPLERELDAMTASRSWRATAPLRALNRRLRRS